MIDRKKKGELKTNNISGYNKNYVHSIVLYRLEEDHFTESE